MQVVRAGLAAFEILAAAPPGSDPILVVLPADHAVADESAFVAALDAAVVEASVGPVVLLGVAPRSAAPRYGYIRAGACVGVDGRARVVESFIEKPGPHRARQLCGADGWLCVAA